MNTIAIIQARMGSTRLPGKVLKKILGKPMLVHIVERVRRANGINDVVIATSEEPINDSIRTVCKEHNITCFSGSEENVLDRFYKAAKENNAEIVLRITGDCPLIDAGVISNLIEKFNSSDVDFMGVAAGAGVATNEFDGHRFPDGLDTEIFYFSILEKAWQNATEKFEKEHVTPYIWKRPDEFKLGSYKSDKDYSEMRWVVDNQEDFELIEQIYAKLYPSNPDFRMNDIINFFKENPNLLEKNKHFVGQEGYEEFWQEKGGKSMNNTKGKEYWKKAIKLIPGGSQLLSKRSEMFLPENWPSYFEKAKGVEVWDMDGNKYVDMSLMGVSACTLGYADEDVNKAVKEAIDKGNASTLNCYEEVELAELLMKIHPWASLVRYARTGGEAVSIAIRIARAYSKKDKIAFCGYHGWHDWYLASNLADDSNLDGNLLPGLQPNGVPRALINTTIPFEYNNIDSLKKLIDENPNQVGVIIMEPSRHGGPTDNFLHKVRQIADENNIVLVFDEISSAWKQNVGGLHLKYGVNPDIVVFSKAMANGYPMAAILGNKKMDAAQDTFISSTMWTERIGPVAALATIKKMQEKNVPAHLDKIGGMIGDGWQRLGEKHGLELKTHKPNALITFAFKEDHLLRKTFFNQEMLKRGYLCSDHVFVSLSHTEEHVKDYLQHVDEVFGMMKKAIDDGTLKDKLEGPVVHSGFKRLVS